MPATRAFLPMSGWLADRVGPRPLQRQVGEHQLRAAGGERQAFGVAAHQPRRAAQPALPRGRARGRRAQEKAKAQTSMSGVRPEQSVETADKDQVRIFIRTDVDARTDLARFSREVPGLAEVPGPVPRARR